MITVQQIGNSYQTDYSIEGNMLLMPIGLLPVFGTILFDELVDTILEV